MNGHETQRKDICHDTPTPTHPFAHLLQDTSLPKIYCLLELSRYTSAETWTFYHEDVSCSFFHFPGSICLQMVMVFLKT